ncbi:lipopolysaccharide biosynthesis protein [Planobispora longispora]|uniref:Lipopolysaccharide biosynthesis protein n=1 Tax=Planobispora longispora TaxID=28887 RepID=A0A8J3W5V0_9ACTN|nr:lipopolysaccharide biosynthesis protein [Planobispora longispora]GIH76216.1 lipopolysaccharide biosynthesis protein [Planobispora longispora]
MTEPATEPARRAAGGPDGEPAPEPAVEHGGVPPVPEVPAPPNPDSKIEEIGDKAGRGLRWSLAGNLVMKAGSFVMSMVLARLLGVEDFGIFAVALAATQFVMVVKDLGVQAAVIQWRGRFEEMTPTATTLSLVSAAGLYAIFWVAAPGFARAAGIDEATGVVRLLTAVILVEAVTAVRSATLVRRFRQDQLTVAIMAGFVAQAAVSITLAIAGAGPYSFAWGQVASALVTGALVMIFARLPYRLGFDREVAGRLWRFGLPSAAGLGLEAVLMNVGYVIVGNVLGKGPLGYFLLAFNVSSWVPLLITSAVRYVSLPSFSRLAEHDAEALQEGVRRAVPLLFSFVVPIAVLMWTLAHPLIGLLYGVKWDQSAGVLRFLVVLMVVRMLTALAFDILTSVGATKSTVWLNLGWGAALVPATFAGAHLDGIRGAAVGHALAGAAVALPLALLALSRVGVGFRPIVPELVRPSLGGLAAGAVSWGVATALGDDFLLELVVAGGSGLVAYILIVVPRDRLRRYGVRPRARRKPRNDKEDR